MDPSSAADDVGTVRDRLHSWLNEWGIGEPDLSQLLIAAGEACSNAVEHSGAVADEEPAAWIEGVVESARVRILVQDRGSWKRAESARDAGVSRGRGRMMMAQLVDRMDTVANAGGTTVTLMKECRIMDSIAPGEHLSAPEPMVGGGTIEAGKQRMSLALDHPGVVGVVGEIDLNTAPLLRAALEDAVSRGRVLLDLRQATYLDSAGVSVLFAMAHHDLHLKALDGSAVGTVLTICALGHVTTVELVAS